MAKKKAVSLLTTALKAVAEESTNACVTFIESTGVYVEEGFAKDMKEFIYNSLSASAE